MKLKKILYLLGVLALVVYEYYSMGNLLITTNSFNLSKVHPYIVYFGLFIFSVIAFVLAYKICDYFQTRNENQ